MTTTSKQQHGMGSGGYCICPKCGQKSAHHAGIPCQEERCASCGGKLLREGSYHHQLWQQKQQRKKQPPS
jgi:hypothetical protein